MLDKTDKAPDPIHDALRDEVRALMAREGLNQRQVADESGIAYGTLTPYMGATYKGDLNRVAEQLQRWLETRRERARTASVLPQVPGFFLSPTAEEIHSILSFAQAARDFGVIVGGAGIGKTTAIKAYARRASNVWVLTADPSMGKANNLLSILAEELEVRERRNAFVSRAVSARVRGTGGLVIIDEAQHLESKAFDQLRTTVLDLGECGVAVVGNESMLARLQGSADRRTQEYAQLHSRAGMRKVQPAAKARDICMTIQAWGIEAPEVVRLLKVIGRKAGALRILNKVISLAAFLSGSNAVADITPELVSRAWAQLSSSPIE